MISFHLYGLIIGIAVVIALELTERGLKKFGKKTLDDSSFFKLFATTMVGGFLGARIWHVLTDFHFYQDDIISTLYVWRGGMSIIGVLIGGVLAMWWWLKINRKTDQLFTLLDGLVLGLPFAQAIGRLGNFFNQELIGLPTDVWWGMVVNSGTKHHPIFAYEAVAMLLLGLWLWQRAGKLEFGRGQLFYIYIFAYSFFRFWLDFLRIDKSMFFQTGLGVNQVFLMIVMVGLAIYYLKLKTTFGQNKINLWQKFDLSQLLAGLVFFAGFVILMLIWSLPASESSSTRQFFQDQSLQQQLLQQQPLQLADHQIVNFEIGDQILKVEVVNTPESITRGLSGRSSIDQDSTQQVDGMLFIFTQPATKTFWMVEMKFDIDIVWFKNGEVIGITPNVPHPSPDTPISQLPTYPSPDLVDWVLELNAGDANQYGITTGMNGMITPDKNE